MIPLLLLAFAAPTPQIPVYFEPNAGQAETGVQYLGRVRGGTLSLRNDRAVLALRGVRVSWQGVGTSGCGALEPVEPLPGKSNYYIGADASRWITGIPQFGGVRCRGLYPGIDVVYKDGERRLEYDFVIAPYANPARIALEFDGADSMSIDSRGDLVLKAGTSEIRHLRPVIYQESGGVRTSVPGGFVRKGKRRIAFRVGAYDRSLPLIIDPVLAYSTFLGSFPFDAATGVGVDSQGNTFVTGQVNGIDFPSSNGNNGGADVFVVKLNSAGALRAAVHFGGAADDIPQGLALDPSGAVYIAGSTKSANFPVTTTTVVVQPVFGGGASDAFVTKLNPSDLTIVYSTFLGGASDDAAASIQVDSIGNAYVAGSTKSLNFPFVATSYQPVNLGRTALNGFVTKLNSTATQLIYSTYLIGDKDSEVRSIAVDSGGQAHVVGATQGGQFPNATGAATAVCGQDGFYLKLSADGTQATSNTCLGGIYKDEANAVAVDSSSSAYVTGSTFSPDFPVTRDSLRRCGSSTDAFITKFNNAGTMQFSGCFGGTRDDVGTAIAVDGLGTIYVTGTTNSTDFPVTADAVQSKLAGGVDIFLTRVNSNGTAALSSTYLGGTQDDQSNAISVNALLIVTVAGTTLSGDFPVTPDAAQKEKRGGADAFVSRLQFPFGVPSINPAGIVNGASFQARGPVAAGSQVSVFGANLATAVFSAPATPLPPDLIGTAVMVNGKAAPLFYVSPTQVNFQLAPELTAGVATMVVTVAGLPSTPQEFTIDPAAPGLYIIPPGNHALAQNQDYSTNSAENPAEAGSVVVVYLTGIGTTDLPTEAGKPAPPELARPVLSYSATIGGRAAEVLFLGLTPGLIGTAQANLRVPALAAGDYPVEIVVGGSHSNTPVLSVKAKATQ
jgi:uncharacterized protein (TIGR03437 family)